MTPSEKKSDSRVAAAATLAALLAAIVFLNCLGNDFVWDDRELIVDNPAVHDLSNFPRFFSDHFWSRADQPSARGYYRPLILLSYAIDYSLWGANPLGFHLSNLLWHALATALVCLLVAETTSSPGAALIAGALFAVHPVHVESVAFISGRTDVIATVFVLASAVLYFQERTRQSFSLRLPLSVFFFALALLSKEVAAVLPVLLLISEVAVVAPGPGRSRRFVHAAYWAVLAGYLGLRFGVLDIEPHLKGSLGPRELLLTMPGVVMDYLQLLVAPVGLCADYVVNPQDALTVSNGAALVAVALACGIAAILVVKKRRSGFFAAWVVVGLVPVMQLIPISVLKAERFLYLPSVGYCALAGLAGLSLRGRLGRRGGPAVAGVFLILAAALSLRTLERTTVWKDEFTLYRVTASCAPNNFRVRYNLGNAYYRAGKVEDALRHTEAAFRLRPDFPRVSYNLGVIYAAKGRLNDAETMYRTAIRLNPDYAAAHNNLATVLYSQGRIEEARMEWSKALTLDPSLHQAEEGLRLLEREPSPRR